MLYEDFLPFIMSDAQGAPGFEVEAHIKSAVRDFCERSQVWKHDFTLDIVAGTHTYAVTIAPEVASAGSAKLGETTKLRTVDDCEIPAMSRNSLDRRDKHWPTKRGDLYAWFHPTPDRQTIRLVNIPTFTRADFITVRGSLVPTQASTECPDFLLEEFEEGIRCGTLFRLFRMQKKPWTDAGLADYYRQMFESAVSDASVRASRDGTRELLFASAFFTSNTRKPWRDHCGCDSPASDNDESPPAPSGMNALWVENDGDALTATPLWVEVDGNTPPAESTIWTEAA